MVMGEIEMVMGEIEAALTSETHAMRSITPATRLTFRVPLRHHGHRSWVCVRRGDSVIPSFLDGPAAKDASLSFN
jgi:hypothetical protein